LGLIISALPSAAARRVIRTTEKAQTPRLAFQYIVATSSDAPGAVSLTTIIAVHQRVDLNRQQKTMTLPVASVIKGAVCNEADLDRLMVHEIRRATLELEVYVKRTPKKNRSR